MFGKQLALCLVLTVSFTFAILQVEDFQHVADTIAVVPPDATNVNAGYNGPEIYTYSATDYYFRIAENFIGGSPGSSVESKFYPAEHKLAYTYTNAGLITSNPAQGSFFPATYNILNYFFYHDTDNFGQRVNNLGYPDNPYGIDVTQGGQNDALIVGITTTTGPVHVRVYYGDNYKTGRIRRVDALVPPNTSTNAVLRFFDGAPGNDIPFNFTNLYTAQLHFQAYSDFEVNSIFFGSSTGCVPDCSAKQCGDDGCGGSCGACSGSDSCEAGLCVAPLPPLSVTQASAESISISDDQTINVNNVYDPQLYSPELPSDSCFASASNPLWYSVASAEFERSLTVSTCETDVDTVIGVYLSDGSLLVCNDDRPEVSSACDSSSCAGLSSLVEVVIPAGSSFLVVVAGIQPSESGDIDLRIQSSVEVDKLIEASTNSIIAATTQLVGNLGSSITSQLSDVSSLVTGAQTALSGSLTDLSNTLDDQFTQVQSAISSSEGTLSAQLESARASLSGEISSLSGSLLAVPDSINDITSSVNTISSNLNALSNHLDSVPAGVQAANSALQTVSGNLDALATHLNDVPSSLSAISSAVGAVDSAIGSLNTNINNQFGSVNGVLDTLSTDINNRFTNVDSAVSGVSGKADSIISNVAVLNTRTSDLSDFIRAAYFESFLLASSTTLGDIPWKWRTPAVAGGSMDDIVVYLTNAYNNRLAGCAGVNTALCNTFRQTASPAFSTLQGDYNSQVAGNKYKKAFQGLQTFYTKLFPIANWV